MPQAGIKELLEAGVHFGHQTHRWNPRMRRFIVGEREDIHIIDLLQTADLLNEACGFVRELSQRGGVVLFVGTKKQAREVVRETAEQAGMPYVTHRWLGGLLTNFHTIKNRIKRLHDLEQLVTSGQIDLLPTRERLAAQADLEKLRANLGGVKDMQRVPDALFVIDPNTEEIAIREAQRLRIPIIALVDTNSNPDEVDYVIPGNDDAMRSCSLITGTVGDAIMGGRSEFLKAEEERLRKEAELRAQRQAEEKARKEAQERARLEAEEQTRLDAERSAAAAAQQSEAAQTAEGSSDGVATADGQSSSDPTAATETSSENSASNETKQQAPAPEAAAEQTGEES